MTIPPNIKLFKLENNRVEKSGRQIDRAVCEDCPWEYEIESRGRAILAVPCTNSLAHHAQAHGAAHSHDYRHFVTLRCDILGLYIGRIVPRSEICPDPHSAECTGDACSEHGR